MQQFSAYDQAALRHRLHGILIAAMQALEEAGRTVCACTDAVPWELTMDMARRVWDAARHIDTFLHLLTHVEGYRRESPETAMPWRCACVQTPEEPVAGVDRRLEGLACDGLAQLMELARKSGDPVIERALDCVLADRVMHERIGRTWLRALPANTPERLRKALEGQQSIDA